MIRKIISHPLTHGLDLDSPKTSELRAKIIKEKGFLSRIYLEWYKMIINSIPHAIHGKVLELGSGGGFFGEVFPDVIKSDIIFLSMNDVVADAHYLPFKSDSLCAIVMTNVLHHIPNPEIFFQSAKRCIHPGGRMIMIEPWVSTWSKFVYTNLHHEPFDPDVKEWCFPKHGPLSGANSALPWILFYRDKDLFSQLFPEWSIDQIILQMPFRYLLSGGVSLRRLMPDCTFNIWKWFENRLDPVMKKAAMFAFISLELRTSRTSKI
jgi:SAM-dependent methyltransferase